MTLLFLLLLAVISVRNSSSDRISSPCPSIFEYAIERQTLIGILKYKGQRSDVHGLTIDQIFMKSQVDKPQPKIRVENDPENTIQKILDDDPIEIISEFPNGEGDQLVQIIVNGRVICGRTAEVNGTQKVSVTFDLKNDKAPSYKRFLRIQINEVGCGKPRVDVRLFGAERSDWPVTPWVAKVFVRGSYMCTANLISRNVAISAAHCFDGGPSYTDVTLGLFNKNASIWSFMVHENYLKPNFDLALIFLNQDIDDILFHPICLWDKSISSNTTAGMLTSFGLTEMGVVGKLHSLELKKASNEACKQSNSHLNEIVKDHHFCAGSNEVGVGPCTGDSGGGFVTNFEGKEFLEGVLSFSLINDATGECDTDNFAVFMDISAFIPWILSENQSPRKGKSLDTELIETVPQVKSEKLIQTDKVSLIAAKLIEVKSFPKAMLATACPNSERKYNRRLGCYQDTRKRLLSEASAVLGTNTPERCMLMCFRLGIKYSGVENGHECYCGNLPPGMDSKISDEMCSKACNGNSNITCGGSLAINVVQTGVENNCPKNDILGLGCYKDWIHRILPHELDSIRLSNTPGKCRKLCLLNGFMYAGTETGNQCFCGNQKPTDELKVSNASCSTKCTGNSLATCGGTGYLDVYETGIRLIWTNSTEMVEAIKSNERNSLAVLSSFCPSTQRKYLRRLGCFKDSAKRVLNGSQVDWSHNTPERCVQRCLQLGFKYGGVEYGIQCFCGNFEPNPSFKLPDDSCNIPCSGNSTLNCGAGFAIDIFETGYESIETCQPVISDLGCYKDADQRMLPHRVDIPRATPTKCIEICLLHGFSYAGTEYGYLCFCGNQRPTLELKVSEDKCNTKCIGDQQLTCGGVFAIRVYETGIKSFYLLS